MLPSSKNYLIKGDFSPAAAEWTRLGCFVAGFIGIQVISRFLHRFIPSDVVDCDHTHAETSSDEHNLDHTRTQSHGDHDYSGRQSRGGKLQVDGSYKPSESTSLLNGENGYTDASRRKSLKSLRRASFRGDVSEDHGRRPSMAQVQTRVMSFVKDTKTNCDENGPCYGYSDPCGRECFKRIRGNSPLASRRSTVARSTTGATRSALSAAEIPQSNDDAIDINCTAPVLSSLASTAQSQETTDHAYESETEDGKDGEDVEAQHHHHVPTNAFMAIGLQTSIAIALHKLPEGFITYATNHANPSLGFTVFMALFIHNITEGFAMALPLYLALGSRFQAMFWSSLLGGFSQPFGAGIAALWFKLAKHTDHMPGFVVYGCMFAVTAGIMASVALALFVESLSVNHNTQLCIASALVGMSILGISTALTA
jgi:ZIP family zinc transporter